MSNAGRLVNLIGKSDSDEERTQPHKI